MRVCVDAYVRVCAFVLNSLARDVCFRVGAAKIQPRLCVLNLDCMPKSELQQSFFASKFSLWRSETLWHSSSTKTLLLHTLFLEDKYVSRLCSTSFRSRTNTAHTDMRLNTRKNDCMRVRLAEKWSGFAAAARTTIDSATNEHTSTNTNRNLQESKCTSAAQRERRIQTSDETKRKRERERERERRVCMCVCVRERERRERRKRRERDQE